MTPAAPRCPGGKRFPHARAAKRYAYETEPDKSRRPVHVQCDGHYHLAPRDVAPDPRRMAGADTNDEQPGGLTMSNELDLRVVRDFARRAILTSAEDVDFMGIAEQFGDDEDWPADEDAAERMHEAIDAEAGRATVTVSWPDEQPQDEPCPCGCEGGPDDCRCAGACRCGRDCLVCEPGAIARAAAEQPQDERDEAMAELTAELESANANAAEIHKQRAEYREEIMRLRARVRELEGAQDERDGDVRALRAFLTHFREDPDDGVLDEVGGDALTIGMLRRIAELDARDAEAEL